MGRGERWKAPFPIVPHPLPPPAHFLFPLSSAQPPYDSKRCPRRSTLGKKVLNIGHKFVQTLFLRYAWNVTKFS